MLKMRQDGLLMGHGDGNALQRNIADHVAKVGNIGGGQGMVACVDSFPEIGGVQGRGG